VWKSVKRCVRSIRIQIARLEASYPSNHPALVPHVRRSFIPQRCLRWLAIGRTYSNVEEAVSGDPPGACWTTWLKSWKIGSRPQFWPSGKFSHPWRWPMISLLCNHSPIRMPSHLGWKTHLLFANHDQMILSWLRKGGQFTIVCTTRSWIPDMPDGSFYKPHSAVPGPSVKCCPTAPFLYRVAMASVFLPFCFVTMFNVW